MKELTDLGIMVITNNGAEIAETNYFSTEHAREGILFFSVNGGCIRLLIPDNQLDIVPDIMTGQEIIITKGRLNGKDGIEIMFEDFTDNPFAVTVSVDQWDMIPEVDDRWKFAAYTRYGIVFQCDRCMVRVSDSLPCLKAWEWQEEGGKGDLNHG